MPQLSVNEILQREKAAWMIKDRWRHLYEEAYEMVMPGINPYVADRNQPFTNNRQFDSTTTRSAIRLANRLLNELTPPDDNWIDIKTGPVLDKNIGDNAQAKKQINDILSGAAMLANMVVNQGEMVDARGLAFLDLVISGMGVLLDMEDMTSDVSPMISQSVPQSEIAVTTDARNRDIEFFRRRKDVFVRDLEVLWADVKIPPALSDLLKKDEAKVNLCEITYWGGPKDNRWYYEVIYTNGEGKEGARIVERVYDICPWTIFRWIRLPGVAYGPGPVLLSLADIRTANKIVEMVLKNAALALSGVYLARDDGVLNPDNITLSQGAILPVASTGGTAGASLVPLQTGRNFDIGQLVLKEFQERIRMGLYDDSLREKVGNPRSAQEIIQLVRDLTQDIGSAIGRLTSDTVNYGRKVVDILVRQGMIEVPIKIDQFTLKLQINSPLANAQQLREVEKIIQWLQTVISIGGPQLALVVAKMPEIMVYIADRLGVPMSLVNSADEIEKVQQDMAQIAASPDMQQAAGAAMG